MRSTFLATDTQVRKDSRGESYLALQLTDRTGSVDARMWKLPDELVNGLSQPEYVHVTGNAQDYRGMLQIKVEHLRVIDSSEVEEDDYIPASEKDRKALAAEVELVGHGFDDPHLRSLFEVMVSDEEFWEAFCNAPAAKSMHHARIGGLLEHSAQCLHVARELVELYPVDRDLVFFGAIFHDVGKIKELSWGKGGFGYTTVGRLKGHVSIGEGIVASYIAELPDFPQELALRISHIMLSHQGELEYGSPERPRTAEALLVHMIDNLDARMTMFAETTHNVSGGGWSSHNNPLRRALYVPEGDPEEEDRDSS